MSGQASSGSSAYSQEDPRDSTSEQSPNKASGQQLLSYPSENQTSLLMKSPAFRTSQNPTEEKPENRFGNWTAVGAPNGRKTLSHVSTKSSVHMWIVLLSALVPIIALAVWLTVASNTHQIFVSLAGSEIGGHFTQTQAKGVDFVCSALLAPLLFAGLNLVWFACARVCAVNESTRSIPLHTLATMSTLSRGTYDPFQYYAVLRGRTWRLAALGGIALCSALGSSALGNMIAYEVFNEDDLSNAEFSFRLLRDATIEGTGTGSGEIAISAMYGFSNSDSAVTAQSVSDVLNRLDLFPATLDEDNGYVGVNATSASMTDLDKSVNALSGVPGYRLSAECVPGAVDSVRVRPTEDRYAEISIYITDERLTATSELSQNWTWVYTYSYSYFSGQEDGIISVPPNSAFPAWGCGSTSCGGKFYIIYMMSGIHRQALNTDYGDIQPAHQYKGDSVSYEAESVVAPTTYWGLQCWLYQQQGFINYTRSSDLQWSKAATSFDDNKTVMSSQLSNWQRVKVDGDWAPPPLGTVIFGRDRLKSCRTGAECLPTRNVSRAVANYVYASGEITRIIHNVAAANTSRAREHPEFYYSVTGTVNKQYYRITYVPVLLLVALVCIILAASLTTALMMSVKNTKSWSWFRQVDVVRLVVDVVGGSLSDQDKQEFAKLSGAADDEISTWSQEYRVAYIKIQKDQSLENEESGHLQPVSVQLVHEAKHRGASLGKTV